jgi:glycosyltransferase involved in cell wall biosynthesis
MRILSLTAGAAQMYCGSCLRDNALARELRRLGHDVVLMPVYTPTKTDEPNESSRDRVLFGGISVWLQQHSALFRRTPRFLDRLWDSRWALKAASKRSIAVDPRELGALTAAMLEGESGPLRKEFLKLEEWLRALPPPGVVNLPNTMLIAMAPVIRRVFDCPVVCTMQGEDLFLAGLPEPGRALALALIARHAAACDGFIAISGFYADSMARYLSIPRAKIHTVPVGVDPADFEPRGAARGEVFRIGYLARAAPEKGLHQLAAAYNLFRAGYEGPSALEAAGYIAPEHRTYLEGIRATCPELVWRGELDRAAKVRFLSSLDAFCVPAAYEEPKGLYLLEALASGVPAVAPARGALQEIAARCGGVILSKPDDPASIAAALMELARDPAKAAALGREGREGVLRTSTVSHMALATLEVYHSLGVHA